MCVYIHNTHTYMHTHTHTHTPAHYTTIARHWQQLRMLRASWLRQQLRLLTCVLWNRCTWHVLHSPDAHCIAVCRYGILLHPVLLYPITSQRVLQCFAVCCSGMVLHPMLLHRIDGMLLHPIIPQSVLQRVAVWCRVLHHIAACCSVLHQNVAYAAHQNAAHSCVLRWHWQELECAQGVPELLGAVLVRKYRLRILGGLAILINCPSSLMQA